MLSIANACGFYGDQLDAPRRLVESARVDYLTLEYLAELTLSILARVREKDPEAGYATDFLEVLESLAPALARQESLVIVTNAGGMNPAAAARAAARILADRQLATLPIGVVTGDDLLPRWDQLLDGGCPLDHLETGASIDSVRQEIVSANAYLGARPLAEALAAGARIVICGRVADAALAVAPAVQHYGWDWSDWRRLAGATVAGHLIECGAQVTGGYRQDWAGLNLEDVGYPIAELDEEGDCVITKPAGSGGCVNRTTVVEQLLYEIGDPTAYLTPDVTANFATVDVEELGADRVAVRGATGTPAPAAYKVSAAYRAGYTTSGQLVVCGEDCVARAQETARIILARTARSGYEVQQQSVEILGRGDAVPGLAAPSDSALREVVLRITVRDTRRAAVERFSRELVPVVTSGPAGLAGYTTARGSVRPVFAYWPTLVPRALIDPHVRVTVHSAAELLC